MSAKKAETARDRTPTKSRKKAADTDKEITEGAPANEVPPPKSSAPTDNKPADPPDGEITEEAPKEASPSKAVTSTGAGDSKDKTTVKEKKTENLATLWEKLDSKLWVVVVYVVATAFLSLKWKPDMMCAFGIATLMACITLYSLYKDEYLKETVVLLVVLGGVGGFIPPDKALNSIEAMQALAASLPTEFTKHRVYKKASEECFFIKIKDPQNPLVKKYEKLYGKPFEPRKDGDWDQYNQFAGCEIKRK